MSQINSRLFAFTLSVLCIFATFFNVAEARVITKKVFVEIVTGTYAGQTGEGIFSYETNRARGRGEETIPANGIQFNFLGQIITGQPSVVLQNGEFKDLLWVAKARGNDGRPFNFGFNSGFNPSQFNRPEEGFVQEGSYFGYLGSDTLIDGAGTVQYIDTERQVRNTPPRVVSGNVLEYRINNINMQLTPRDFNKLSLQLTAGQKPALVVSLKERFSKKLAFFSSNNLGKPMHLSINGIEFSAPIIQSSLGSEMLLTGVPFEPAVKFMTEFNRTMQ